MEGVPGNIDIEQVREAIFAIPGVQGVHDLHVWTITSGMVAMSGHVAVDPAHGLRAELLECTHQVLHDRFAIGAAAVSSSPPTSPPAS